MLTSADLAAILPVLVVTATGLVVLVVDWFVRPGEMRPQAALALVGLVVALVALLQVPQGVAIAQEVVLPGGATLSTGMVRVDGFGLFAQAALLATAGLTVLISVTAMAGRGRYLGEFVMLLLFATAAMMLLTVANDLVLAFLAIETFSLALYVLAGFWRGQRMSQEAALKYFVLGAFAAGFLLYGAALLYGATGSVNLDAIQALLAARHTNLPALPYVGLALLLVGLGFKVALVPFHQWTPDVYEGAPLPVTAFMATATKVAAFAVLFRVLWTAFPALADLWQPLLAALAVLTMFVGNLAALAQSDLKRMLAYSAVAQAGYLLVAVVAGGAAGAAALLFYLLMYAWMTLGAFAGVVALGRVGPAGREATNLTDLTGLARRHAGLAFALALFLVSLTGLPPTAGFLGKWYIFQAAVGAGHAWLAVVLVVNSVLSAFYYLRPVVLMYMAEPTEDERIEAAIPVAVVVAVTAAVVGGALLLAGPLASGASAAGMAGAPPAGGDGLALYLTAPGLWPAP